MAERRGVLELPNKLGEVTPRNGHKFIKISVSCPECGMEAVRIIDLPESLKDIPDGFLVYVDDKGQLQALEEDPHDYR